MRNLAQILREMKGINEIMSITASTSVLLGDRNLAKVVVELHEKLKHVRDEAYHLLFGLRGIKKDVLITITDIVENISDMADSAEDMANLVIKGKELHPILKSVLGEEERRVFLILVKPGPLVGRSLMELNLETKAGVRVLAIKREEKWVISPAGKEKLRENDLLLCVGKEKGRDLLKKAIAGTVKI